MCSLDTYPFYSWHFDFSSFSCPPQLSPSNLFALCISCKVLWVSKPVDRQPCPCLFFISFFSDRSISDLFSLLVALFPSSCCPVALPTEILTHWTVAQMISDFFYCDTVFIEKQKIACIFPKPSPSLHPWRHLFIQIYTAPSD